MLSSEIKILLVDDNPDIIEFLSYNLSKEGYQISTASDGEEAIKKAVKNLPHLILLDVMMPKLDGVETCYQLRELPSQKNTLIAFLTARHEEYSEIAGFQAGADDYIQKPIRPRLLITRIKALLRRHPDFCEQTLHKIIQFENIFIHKDNLDVKVNNESIELARKEFDILFLLASRPLSLIHI